MSVAARSIYILELAEYQDLGDCHSDNTDVFRVSHLRPLYSINLQFPAIN